ncbi:MAG: TMEM165/GDT1 family protein [Polyangiales bacterium]
MDWKLFSTAFVTVFIAELGDKTQLAALGLAAGSRGRVTVFVGASLALVCTTALAVVAADAITRLIDPLTLRRAAALLFIALGVWSLWQTRTGAA